MIFAVERDRTKAIGAHECPQIRNKLAKVANYLEVAVFLSK